tara:strand:+ start:16556 stop:17194 length:639 start_codon:yes stop_codon:yes gene_type:complete
MPMRKMSEFTSLAAPLPENNIDTDVIFPARFLLILAKEGVGQYAFHERRKGAGSDFVLDRPPYDKAEILVTGSNFGTGSSREQAVWTLADLGIRCVIARSFGEIFFSNCYKNGVLPIVLGEDAMLAVEAAANAAEQITVDLPNECLRLANGTQIAFTIEPYRKQALMAGLDEVGMILTQDLAAIEAYESRRKLNTPWVTAGSEQLELHSGND